MFSNTEIIMACGFALNCFVFFIATRKDMRKSYGEFIASVVRKEIATMRTEIDKERKDEATDTEREFAAVHHHIDSEVQQLAESLGAMRQQIQSQREWTMKEFTSIDTFKLVVDEVKQSMKAIGDGINNRLDRFEGYLLDGVRSGNNSNGRKRGD